MTRTRFALIALMVVLPSTGCRKDEKAKLRDMIKDYTEVTDALATVKDMPSYEAAKPRLNAFYSKQREEMQKAMAEAKKNQGKVPVGKAPTSGDKERAQKEFEKMKNDPDYQKLNEVLDRYGKELTRVMLLPQVGPLFMKEMMAFGG